MKRASHIASRRSGEAGMTLIEVMVAVGILTLMTSLIWVSFSQSLRTQNTVRQSEERYLMVRTAMARMTRELSMAFLSQHRGPLDLNPHTFFMGEDHGTEDRLSFTSLAHRRLYRDADESEQTIITYYVASDPHDKRRKHLYRKETRRLNSGDHPNPDGPAYVICEDVTRFELTYYDPRVLQWLDTWNTTTADGKPDRLPDQVRITLGFLDGGREVIIPTRARIYLQQPMGF
jgi:general secretion pathway protein J